jgi:nitric oxide reductase NorD protein
VRFDLDLPSAAHDDIPLQSGILLPEWDWKKQQLKRDMCSLTLLDPRNAAPCELPAHLLRPARRLRHQFEALTPARRWLKNQPEGPELDIDACVRAFADRRTGHAVAAPAATWPASGASATCAAWCWPICRCPPTPG